MHIYLDTSAYLESLLGGPKAGAIIRLSQQRSICSSTILLIETERNLLRLARSGNLDSRSYQAAQQQLRTDIETFTLLDPSPGLCLNGQFPVIKLPKSSDLLHLRSASWFLQNGGLLGFLSLDDSQNDAAVEFGLPIQRLNALRK